jgi:alpha-amylase
MMKLGSILSRDRTISQFRSYVIHPKSRSACRFASLPCSTQASTRTHSLLDHYHNISRRKVSVSSKRASTSGNASANAATTASDEQQQQTLDADDQSYPGPLEVPRPLSTPWEDVILMQAFGWESSKQGGNYYEAVQSAIPDLIKAGITHCWLPPPSHSVSKEGYLPTQLYDLRTSYGDYHSLVSLNTSLLNAGIRPVADIVINHRCADEQNEDGIWNKFHDDIPHPGRRIDWDATAIASTDPDFQGRGHADSGADYGPSPDLDHENEEVRLGLRDWMLWLRDYIGFEGWRLDFVKGYSPEAAAWYIENSLRNPGKDFCVAEYWVDAAWSGSYLQYNQDAMRQGLCDWMDKVGNGFSATFDFTTKAILQEAIRKVEYDRLRDKNNKPSGLIGWWPTRAVTFIDNHDTGSTQKHWPFPSGDEKILQGYAYILTHPGIPCIFWEHFTQNNTLKQQIVELLALRKRAGIKADSKIKILAAEKDYYLAEINSTVVLKLGPRYDGGDVMPKESDGWVVAASGKDWAAWEKSKK